MATEASAPAPATAPAHATTAPLLPPPSTRWRTPDHPPYAAMIQEAIQALKDPGGSTPAAIDGYIKETFLDLPWGHRNLFPHYFRKLVLVGEIRQGAPGRFVVVGINIKGSEEIGKKPDDSTPPPPSSPVQIRSPCSALQLEPSDAPDALAAHLPSSSRVEEPHDQERVASTEVWMSLPWKDSLPSESPGMELGGGDKECSLAHDQEEIIDPAELESLIESKSTKTDPAHGSFPELTASSLLFDEPQIPRKREGLWMNTDGEQPGGTAMDCSDILVISSSPSSAILEVNLGGRGENYLSAAKHQVGEPHDQKQAAKTKGMMYLPLKDSLPFESPGEEVCGRGKECSLSPNQEGEKSHDKEHIIDTEKPDSLTESNSAKTDYADGSPIYITKDQPPMPGKSERTPNNNDGEKLDRTTVDSLPSASQELNFSDGDNTSLTKQDGPCHDQEQIAIAETVSYPPELRSTDAEPTDGIVPLVLSTDTENGEPLVRRKRGRPQKNKDAELNNGSLDDSKMDVLYSMKDVVTAIKRVSSASSRACKKHREKPPKMDGIQESTSTGGNLWSSLSATEAPIIPSPSSKYGSYLQQNHPCESTSSISPVVRLLRGRPPKKDSGIQDSADGNAGVDLSATKLSIVPLPSNKDGSLTPRRRGRPRKTETLGPTRSKSTKNGHSGTNARLFKVSPAETQWALVTVSPEAASATTSKNRKVTSSTEQTAKLKRGRPPLKTPQIMDSASDYIEKNSALEAAAPPSAMPKRRGRSRIVK